MTQYVGLDVSLKETKLHVLDEAGNRVWRGRCATDPTAIAAAVRRYAPTAARIGLETGPLTTWLWTALTAEGLPMICLDARHAKKALDMKVNKTDANDAEGLAHLVRAGWYREVRVKGRSAMLAKALLGARSQLLSMSLALENQIRGILKTFGRIVPKGAGGLFEKNVRALIMDDAEITAVIMPLLQARQMARGKCAALDRRIIRSVQGDATCRMPHDGARDWAHHRRRLCRRAREARYLQAVARGWCLARAYTAALPVGRSGLRRPHLEAW